MTSSNRWGNVPAIDVINLGANENDATKDLNIAFVASHDMRHVVKTINSLPSNLSGNLTILLNDITTPIACRNLALLFILGMIPDEALAADVALHLWYSVFLPEEYRVQVGLAIAAALDKSRDDSITVPIGKRSTVSWFYPPEAVAYLVNLAPDAEISKLSTPSPNTVEFKARLLDGTIGIGYDSSDPLEGWDISAVIAAGKAHGARPEDIYGCIYFYLTEQLRMFAKRLRELSISFKLYSTEACGLAQAIKSGRLTELDLPPTVRFNRIEVSNILDAQYVGMDAVLTTWGPLLSDNPFATIVGYFLNWPLLEKDGDPTTCEDEDVIDQCIKCVMDRDERRLRVPLRSPPDALPEFPDDDNWYDYTNLNKYSWAERFVEFSRK
ncbi:hypothetical protein EST38_g3502 [Candolleomyces aberdarensis]|uniref:DUF4470 domain-containing protein n=1 Tax=Candolleomyces aberdarensis TaxID=2316362 RepID=A0A4Q2DRY3_9AGAR|nr:hypothetical protein EST38_g3502 [Candolleomyces aberdarensis]